MHELVIKAIVSSIFDRVDSCVPPCTPAEEFDSQAIQGYIHGVLDHACSLIQCLSLNEVFMTDIYDLLKPSVDTFIKGRLQNPEYSFPETKPIVREIIKHIS